MRWCHIHMPHFALHLPFAQVPLVFHFCCTRVSIWVVSMGCLCATDTTARHVCSLFHLYIVFIGESSIYYGSTLPPRHAPSITASKPTTCWQLVSHLQTVTTTTASTSDLQPLPQPLQIRSLATATGRRRLRNYRAARQTHRKWPQLQLRTDHVSQVASTKCGNGGDAIQGELVIKGGI